MVSIADFCRRIKQNGYYDHHMNFFLSRSVYSSGGGGSTYTPTITVYNNSGEEVPAYAAMEVTNVDVEGIHYIRKPATDSLASGFILFNTDSTISVGETGSAYHCTDAPATGKCVYGSDNVGNEFGTVANQWYLSKEQTGFVCIGDGGFNESGVMRPY